VIDFRYHLVSLISVFLALAVGIVLGAGPLEGSIGDQLNEQVRLLREDRDALREQLAIEQAGGGHRDEFLREITPALIGRQLGGRNVVVITLPDADGGTAEEMSAALEQAGARVTGRVDIRDGWADPQRQTSRDEVAARLVAFAGGAGPGASTEARLAASLARACVTAVLTDAGSTDPAGETVIAELVAADLIQVTGNVAERASEAVVIAPAVRDAPAPQPSPSAQPPAEIYLALIAAVDAAGEGSVVTGPASSADGGGLLEAVRDDDELASAVSTVDTAGTPMGPLSTVLALREQQLGAAGSYGFAKGADLPLPDLPAAS
jgi:hypothetical protein